MKTKTVAIFTSLLVTIFFASCAPKEIPKAENFSFVFEESSCGHLPWLNVLDTTTGTLTHTPLDDGAESIEIPFVLSESEMEMIYQEIISKNFLDYPSEVRVIGETPPSTFRLKVINGDIIHQVKWTSDLENSEPNYPETDGLIDLYIFIQEIIHSHPEYPESKSGLRCA
jgi:hypothetical protein